MKYLINLKIEKLNKFYFFFPLFLAFSTALINADEKYNLNN